MIKMKQKVPGLMMNDKLQKIVDEIEKLTVLEVSELVKALEEKFGVPQPPMAMAAAPAAAAAAAPG